MAALYLVRHAAADDRDAARWPDDGLRPLTPRGVRRFREAAAGLRTLLAPPARVLTSPLLRATQTAVLLTTHAGWPAAIEVAAFGGDDLEGQVAELRGHANDADGALAIVGHQPGLGQMAAWVLTGDGAHVGFEWRKGGIAVLQVDRFDTGTAVLDGFYPPRSLRAMVAGRAG